MHFKRSIYIVDSTFSQNRFLETHNTIVGEGFCFAAVRSSHICMCCSGDNAQSPLFTCRECFSYVCFVNIVELFANGSENDVS